MDAKHDIAAAAAVTAVGSACSNIFLAAERYLPVTAVTCSYLYFNMIDKHICPFLLIASFANDYSNGSSAEAECFADAVFNISLI